MERPSLQQACAAAHTPSLAPAHSVPRDLCRKTAPEQAQSFIQCGHGQIATVSTPTIVSGCALCIRNNPQPRLGAWVTVGARKRAENRIVRAKWTRAAIPANLAKF